MKTPYAILIGLALIAAALFFRQPSVAPAQAGLIGDVDGFECYDEACAVLHRDKTTFINTSTLQGGKMDDRRTGHVTNWR